MKKYLEKSIKAFKEKQHEFVETNHGKFVLIYNGEVIGFYENVGSAYMEGKSMYEQEPFLVRQCLTVDEEKNNEPVFHSRVA